MSYNHGDSEQAGDLHHVELCSSNLERSIGFWDWLLGELGYEPKNEWENGRSWIKGPTYIVLKQAGNSELPFDRTASGLNHIAFHASSREQVDELTSNVRERADSTVLYDEQHPYAGGYYALYCENPDGVKVEIVGPE
ncbi:glyoxalase [Halogeometricum borinquense]|uniref:Glyoxalase n=1 Tax=Halogeometricum borinquense TaxID=60847 RepID=A0A482SYJ0_9EURY|nr:VOC family protein [Halogeometricum borinquense]RYJ08684.1 glyoxalase [Halogeometricum borinquense]